MNRAPTDITGSRRRRSRARAIRLVLRGLVGALVVAVVAGLVWLVGFSPALAVSSVEVRGTSVLTTDQVTAAAQVPLGTPLLRLDTAPIQARVAALPPVARVEVTRSWPQGVRITVVERTPTYALRNADGTVSLVDRAGVAYFVAATAPDGLLQAELAKPDPRLQRDVATVVAALPAVLRDQATLVTAQSVDHIVIRLDGGRQVIWGSADQSEVKAQVAAALLVTRASVYDVSAPSHPATKA